MTTLGTLSDWQTTDIIGYLATTQWWASLHSADPRVGSPTAAEFTGGSYARVLLDMEAVSARVLRSATGPAWGALAAGTISYVGLFTASIGGNLRAAMPLDVPYPVLAGDGYAIPADTIYVSW